MMKEDFPISQTGSSPNLDDVFFNVQDLEPPPFNIEIVDDLLEAPLQNIAHPDQEETLDVAAKYQWATVPFMPYVNKLGAPERHVFGGDLDFQVEINGADTNRKKYLYSAKLNRIYVDMKTNFSVQFSWDHALSPRPMYVRATVVFSDVSQAEKRVERCTQHTHDTSNAGLMQAIVKNVLHSARDLTTPGVYYCGIPEQADSWYSVVVEFPTTSAGPYMHAYQFVCKNSCSTGINRRGIYIIFELEDNTGKVYGRQIVGARACSCPLRDKRRDESDEDAKKGGKKRVQTSTEADRRKKVKLETVEDDEVIVMPQVEVISARAVVAGLAASLSVMEFDAALQTDPTAIEKYKTCIAALKSQIDHYKSPNPPTQ